MKVGVRLRFRSAVHIAAFDLNSGTDALAHREHPAGKVGSISRSGMRLFNSINGVS